MLTVTESEIILGITIDNLLLFDKHTYFAIQKEYITSNMILYNIKGANIKMYISLFKFYVSPILIYGSVAYLLHYTGLINTIQKLPINCSKKSSVLCKMTNLQRSNVCNVKSPEERIIKIYLILMYKNLHNLICINFVKISNFL